MKKIKVFTATWCGPCKMIKPIIQEIEAEGLVEVEYLDADEYREQLIKEGITGVPTILYLKDGVEYNRTTGYLPKEKIMINIEVK